MARVHLTFDAVREFGLALPGVVKSTIYGAPSLKVHNKLLACVPVNKSAEPNCAVIPKACSGLFIPTFAVPSLMCIISLYYTHCDRTLLCAPT
jgi:hypothetical protein